MSESDSQATSQPPTDQQQVPQSPAEWISFVIAVIILAGVLGGVGYLWASDRKQQPPILEAVTHSDIRQAGGQYYVSFTVINTGGETAETVQVVAELRLDGRLIEAGEQQIDFLSSQEEVAGAFIFTQNPQQAELTVRVASYKLP
ncbi:MAG: TIGR02588 family protein [Leptolyngbya sp. SIO4C1]|nr:TIGR02588 family protein [Leptolyngbya sp. SIO4C1]